MKRQRGLKRYYRNLETHNDFVDMQKSLLDFSNPDAWFDNWHWHFDWKGVGNNSFKRRKPHLDKLFRHFEILAELIKEFKKEFHLYVFLFDYESSSDAIFIHTSNPNNNCEFPIKFPSLSKQSNLTNTYLQTYIDKLEEYVKLYGKVDENFCILYKNNVGQPIFYEQTE